MSPRPRIVPGTRSTRVPGRAALGRRRQAARARDQGGAVTAEAAMVIPVLVLMVAALAWMLTVAVAQVRVTDAAREVARLLARDETTATALAKGREVAPPGSEFAVTEAGGDVVVKVRLDLEGPGGVARLVPGLAVDATAVAVREAP